MDGVEVEVSDELDFDAWVASRVRRLLRFGYLVTGSQHEAEDAVQQALASAYEKWGRVRRAADPDQYVRRMIVNAHVSGWRRFGRRESPAADVRLPETADPADAVDLADEVWRICSALPRQQRAAVVLRFYEDLDYSQIAAVLECTEATARSHIHRALAALRTALGEEDDDA